MIRILFVCTANLCRSPLAVGILRKKFRERNIEAIVDSAGFEPHLIGEEVDIVTSDYAKQKGIDLSHHIVRMFVPEDFDKFDRIFVMDYRGYKDVMFHARHEEDKGKVEYLLNVLLPGQNKTIPHMLNSELSRIEEAYKLIDKACEKIVSSYQRTS
jgi:protein-tyrosine phosphatase